MADLANKENLSPVGQSPYATRKSTVTPSPATKKSRSKSIGPGGLEAVVLENQQQNTPDRNRRKSSAAPAVKSILPSKEDEAKRREARRKSLANRRVSFAPEATLHTWDVVEYMRDATTSSASSENTRRASSVARSPASEHDSDPPSTPPEQADDDDVELRQSPAHQRDLHQKKRRRSSAIPPLDFNNPDDAYSSSPVGSSSPVLGSDDDEHQFEEGGEDAEEEEDDDEGSETSDGDSTAMSLVSAENTATMTGHTNGSSATSESSARLDAALRQASDQAGTRGIDFDEHGDMSMELATEEVTNAFKPWAEQNVAMTPMAKNLIALQEQENINPFSPAFRAQLGPRRPSTIQEEDEDMSMDMTRAVGGIVAFDAEDESNQSMEDQTMDFTQVVGRIHQLSPIKKAPALKSALKRRLSTTDTGSPSAAPSPQKQNQPSPSKRVRLSTGRASLGEGTMDLTTAFGGLTGRVACDETMDFTTAVGGIKSHGSPVKQSRRTSIKRRRSSGLSTMSNEPTMDFTMAVGGIKVAESGLKKQSFAVEQPEDEEELSMEVTTALGGIVPQPQSSEMERPVTPRHLSSPTQDQPPTTPAEQERFREATDLSAKKLLTPIFEKQINISPARSPMARQSPASSKAGTPKAGPLVSRENSPARKHVTPNSGTSTPVEGPALAQVKYPTLEAAERLLTPKSSPVQPKNESPRTPKTPVNDNFYPTIVASPTPQRPIRSSPGKAGTASGKAPGTAPSSLADGIKLLSTPRKDTGTSPLKRLKDMTPKPTPVRNMLTPRKIATPRTRTPRAEPKAPDHDPAGEQLKDDLVHSMQDQEPVTHVHLNDFLQTAGIRFMDLTTTKRRYTVAPTPAKSPREVAEMVDAESNAPGKKIENAVVAGACTIPELDLYQHSCRELKRYISEGKTFLRTLEDEVYSSAPPLIQAYMSATPERRLRLDAHMRDAKTRARLQSKELWYGWRGQLLEGLEDGLRSIKTGLQSDSDLLREKETLMEHVLPTLREQLSILQEDVQAAEEAAAAISDEDKEELESSRERLGEISDLLQQRRTFFDSLQQDFEEQERLAETYIDAKSECIGAIEEAERVKEAARAVSAEEIADLNVSVQSLEKSTGWSIQSSSSSSLTMTYRNQLRLFFDTAGFLPSSIDATAVSTPRKRSPKKRDNRPISLSYIADADEHHPQPLSTEKRFFLQLMRAQLQCLVQHQTSTKNLLSFVSRGWDTASALSETVRRLRLEYPIDVSILSDERLGIHASMLLPKVQTKVVLSFEISASIAESQTLTLQTSTDVKGQVVYGEQYKEGKMGEFVKSRIGNAVSGWGEPVRDLRARLVATGRKGT